MSVFARIRELMGDMTIPAFAALIEEEKVQRLKDVLAGRQRVPEDMLVRIVVKTGCDANWLLLGVGSAPQLTSRQRALLNNYDATDEVGKKIIEGTASLAAQPKAAQGGRK